MEETKWNAKLTAANGKVIATVCGARLVVEHKIGTWLPTLIDGDVIEIKEEISIDNITPSETEIR